MKRQQIFSGGLNWQTLTPEYTLTASIEGKYPDAANPFN